MQVAPETSLTESASATADVGQALLNENSPAHAAQSSEKQSEPFAPRKPPVPVTPPPPQPNLTATLWASPPIQPTAVSDKSAVTPSPADLTQGSPTVQPATMFDMSVIDPLLLVSLNNAGIGGVQPLSAPSATMGHSSFADPSLVSPTATDSSLEKSSTAPSSLPPLSLEKSPAPLPLPLPLPTLSSEKSPVPSPSPSPPSSSEKLPVAPSPQEVFEPPSPYSSAAGMHSTFIAHEPRMGGEKRKCKGPNNGGMGKENIPPITITIPGRAPHRPVLSAVESVRSSGHQCTVKIMGLPETMAERDVHRKTKATEDSEPAVKRARVF